MTMERNNRDYRFALNSLNGKDSFQEHNDRMREFRRAHAAVALVNAPRYGESAILARTEPLQLKDIIIEAGGTGFLDNAMNWSAYVPVPKVAGYKLSQN